MIGEHAFRPCHEPFTSDTTGTRASAEHPRRLHHPVGEDVLRPGPLDAGQRLQDGAVRRFICSTDNCPRRTFAEPFAQLTAPYARFTTRLGQALERVGLALAGRADARLTAHLGFQLGRMTLLRKVMALPDPQPSTPRVLGVDDFATRRGQTYSTVLTCGETHRVVEVIPTRDSGPPAAWLATHPGVEIICRDRAGACAEGARLGAPAAIQVADRFHLWQGIGRAVETCVAAHRECLGPTASTRMDVESSPDDSLRDGPDLDGRRAQRKKAAHALVHELLAQGHSRRAIARHLGWGLNTVLRYARAATWQDALRENRPRPSPLDPYKPYLERRFAAGCTNVTCLHRELIAENAPVTYQMVRACIATLCAAPLKAPPPAPAVRRVTGWLTRHPSTLSEDERAALKDVAVTAGLTLHWSSGGTGGAVNRIKKIKRQLYGRAGFELLRKMVLLQ